MNQREEYPHYCGCGHLYREHDPEDGNCEAGSFPPCACGYSKQRAAKSRRHLTHHCVDDAATSSQPPTTPDWQQEHDRLLDTVVALCVQSRDIDPDPAQQGRWLRDRLFAMCDPLFVVRQRLEKSR